MLSPEAVIARFAESVGRPNEVRLYVEHWRSSQPERFALIDLSSLEDDVAISALLADLHYLCAINLYPVLVGATAEVLDRLSAARLPIAVVSTPSEARDASRRQEIAVAERPTLSRKQLARWLSELESRKLIILGDGALRLESGDVVSLVNTTTERDILATTLIPAHRDRFADACEILAQQDASLTVGLTTALDLLRELFTVRGAGTLLRVGSALRSVDRPDAADKDRLRALLSNAFGRHIKASFFEREHARTIIAGDFRGAAIIENASPAPYLSKFAVGSAARGEGVGRDLWQEVVAQFPRLVWRARRNNPISNWYQSHSDGSFRADPWTVFWRKLDPAELEAAIKLALDRPDDFEG